MTATHHLETPIMRLIIHASVLAIAASTAIAAPPTKIDNLQLGGPAVRVTSTTPTNILLMTQVSYGWDHTPFILVGDAYAYNSYFVVFTNAQWGVYDTEVAEAYQLYTANDLMGPWVSILGGEPLPESEFETIWTTNAVAFDTSLWSLSAITNAGSAAASNASAFYSAVQGAVALSTGATAYAHASAVGSTQATVRTQLATASNTAANAVASTNGTAHVLTVVGPNTTNSAFKVGTLEIQPYALNNVFLTENCYYSGGWKYRATGPAGMFYFYGNEGQFRFFPSGTGGSALPSFGGTVGALTQVKVNSSGTVAIGGSMNAAVGDYSGAALVAWSNGTISVNGQAISLMTNSTIHYLGVP